METFDMMFVMAPSIFRISAWQNLRPVDYHYSFALGVISKHISRGDSHLRPPTCTVPCSCQDRINISAAPGVTRLELPAPLSSCIEISSIILLESELSPYEQILTRGNV